MAETAAWDVDNASLEQVAAAFQLGAVHEARLITEGLMNRN